MDPARPHPPFLARQHRLGTPAVRTPFFPVTRLDEQWAQLDRSVTRSFGHLVIWSFGHSVTQTCGHSAPGHGLMLAWFSASKDWHSGGGGQVSIDSVLRGFSLSSARRRSIGCSAAVAPARARACRLVSVTWATAGSAGLSTRSAAARSGTASLRAHHHRAAGRALAAAAALPSAPGRARPRKPPFDSTSAAPTGACNAGGCGPSCGTNACGDAAKPAAEQGQHQVPDTDPEPDPGSAPAAVGGDRHQRSSVFTTARGNSPPGRTPSMSGRATSSTWPMKNASRSGRCRLHHQSAGGVELHALNGQRREGHAAAQLLSTRGS